MYLTRSFPFRLSEQYSVLVCNLPLCDTCLTRIIILVPTQVTNFVRKTLSNKTINTGLERPSGLQDVEALSEFLDDRHVKVVNLSALRNGRLYHSGDIPGTHFC